MADWMEDKALEEEWEEEWNDVKDERDVYIYCTGCKKIVKPRLAYGSEMYPNRTDLESLRFWVCRKCGAFVGTHHKTKDSLKPLGFLATKDIKRMRMQIHAVLDPLWKSKKIKRGKAYAYISHRLGRTYHTAEIYSVEEGKQIYEIVKELKKTLDPGPWNL